MVRCPYIKFIGNANAAVYLIHRIHSNRVMHEICERRKIQQQKMEKIVLKSEEKLRHLMENDLVEEKNMIEKK